jgi:RNA polymerase sigma factor (sigma-70 family)
MAAHPDTASEAELDALMARLAQGDRGAFEPLFRALHPRALRLSRARLDAAQADDAAQSALMKVFARAHEFTPGRAVLPWFYAVVANEVRALRRRVRADVELDPSLASEVRTDEALLQQELQRALARAVAALDAPSAEAIAALLGQQAPLPLAAATFRKRVSRAYARLRVLLGELR